MMIFHLSISFISEFGFLPGFGRTQWASFVEAAGHHRGDHQTQVRNGHEKGLQIIRLWCNHGRALSLLAFTWNRWSAREPATMDDRSRKDPCCWRFPWLCKDMPPRWGGRHASAWRSDEELPSTNSPTRWHPVCLRCQCSGAGCFERVAVHCPSTQFSDVGS